MGNGKSKRRSLEFGNGSSNRLIGGVLGRSIEVAAVLAEEKKPI